LGAKARPRSDGILRHHAADLWAIGLATAGILLALALYGGAAGLVGRGVDDVLGTVVGWTRFVLPPVCLAAGILAIAGHRRPERFRTATGAVLGLLAVSGLAELAGGSPTLGASALDLRGAGGWVGVAAGRPLQLGMGTIAAVVVLVAVAAVGIVLSTGISLSTLGRGLATATGATWRAVGRVWGGSRMDRSGDPGGSGADRDPALSLPLAPAAAPAAGTSDGDAMSESGDVASSNALPPGGDGDPSEEPASAAVAKRKRMKEISSDQTMGPAVGQWKLPDMTILTRSGIQRHDERQLAQAGEDLVAALAAHGVETRLVGRTVGPTVTRYELELGSGVKVARVTSLSRDIAYAMASADVRILAPIPGMSAIGVEVPNRRRQLVSLADILTSEEAARALHPLEVALGRDIAGRPVMVNLADMPHVLISGATGAGKSSCINSLITSVLMRATPDQVRMILIDPKRVELGQYNGLPHLLAPVVVDPKKAANALAWAVKEMERRYDLLAEHGVRDITGYNEAYDRGELDTPGGLSVRRQVEAVAERAKAAARAEASAEIGAPPSGMDVPGDGALRDKDPEAPGASGQGEDGALAPAAAGETADEGQGESDEEEQGPERLPFVLVVVDELNDLMMVAARDVEDSVCRIAQMARAVGIHLVLATQRPSVDVITGVIKANIPSRMAFSVSSLADSRVILDQPGAERLIGKGDMLLLTASSSVPRRIQGPWVSEGEVRAVVAHWRRQGRIAEPAVGIEGVEDGPGGAPLGGGDDDELLAQAMDLVVRSQLGSTSMLQRKLRVGFARAGRLMDLLERRGVVGPSEGSKARAVLMTTEELDSHPG